MAAFSPFKDYFITPAGKLVKDLYDYVALRLGDGLLTALTTTEKGSLVGAINEVNNGIVSGMINIPNGQTIGTETVPPGFDDVPVVATLMGIGTSTLYVRAANISGTTLTIHVDQDPADPAGVNVHYIVDAR